MARLYTSNNLKSKGVRGASEVEASKINEMNINQQVFQRKQEYKNSDENTHNNSHRWAKGRNFGEDATDIHPELSKEDNQDKEVTSGDENERKTMKLNIPIFNDSNGNFLRRSIRNTKNGGSYRNMGRRPFKYDDFEYGPTTGKKTANEMSPPSNSSIHKRRNKQGYSNSPAFGENSVKRSFNAKIPSSSTSMSSIDKNEVVYNQGRWTCLEHFKFLEALKKYGKEWQKVQQHVNTRTSTQARSHAQKFFVKLDKKALTLDEFLRGLDLKEVEKNLLASGMDNTDYDEEREVNIIANRKKGASVMNIALPSNTEEKKKHEGIKRKRSELDKLDRNDKNQSISNIRKAFEEHAGEPIHSGSQRADKRVKTSEQGEKGYSSNGDDKPISENTDIV
eukprot:CAMPEP_0197004594 /NCGR_PEP_ID=MMETSP1380-20130617/23801_1 /TAXON_ID=5936 /ORGANISM="Euplotes crassus, Strain CT5" /LENGTH=392 /DNA_ID=CAMNT_0042423439 /DNA_START=21 /DNA_END=1200 /DNA_ORIENTATION=+